MKKQLAIFASGSGTNAEAIIEYFTESSWAAVTLVLTNKPDAFVLKRAESLNVDSIVFSASELKEGKVLKSLLKYGIDFVVLAGFMKLVPSDIVAAFPNRIVNIHPALLPKYGGKGMYGMNVHKAVVESKDRESGITIHYVNEHYDEGNIILQVSCPVLPTDSPTDLAQRIHGLEHANYPKTIARLIDNL